jgi:hypothetical protein
MANNQHTIFQALQKRYTRVHPSNDVPFRYLAHHNLILGLLNHLLWHASQLEKMYHCSRVGLPWFQKKTSRIIVRDKKERTRQLLRNEKKKKKRTSVVPNRMNT